MACRITATARQTVGQVLELVQYLEGFNGQPSSKTGFGGLGTLYVNAAGNGGVHGERNAVEFEYTTHDENNSHIGAVPVCAVGQDGLRITDISEMGTNLWVCGLSDGINQAGIFTTSQYGRYRYGFGGTSSASPTVGGSVALIRDAYPALSYRDIKLILAGSAQGLTRT